MALYVGLDVSLKTTSMCIVGMDGSAVWEGKLLKSYADRWQLRETKHRRSFPCPTSAPTWKFELPRLDGRASGAGHEG
jgi:hypothetical protein